MLMSRFRSVVEKDRIEAIGERLQTIMQDPKCLLIPKLRVTLTKLQDLLDRCKEVGERKDAIEQFMCLVKRLIDDVLDPVLTEKLFSELETSRPLNHKFQSLIRGLYDAVPESPQYSALSYIHGWMFGKDDVTNVLANVNPRIDLALQGFMTQEVVQRTTSTQNHQGRSNLEPMVHDVLRALPRFRVLVLGKSGVGKTSVISCIFNAIGSDMARPRASINEEITSNKNPHFVVHDSLGYEYGSVEQYHVVENFIKQRGQQSDVSEQIHAIWLCMETPVNSAHVFEDGDVRVFQMDLGQVPLVVVLTRCDRLNTVVPLNSEGKYDKKLDDQSWAEAENRFTNYFVKPLNHLYKKKLKRSELPLFVKVSVCDGYEDTFHRLVQLTRQSIAFLVDPTPPSELSNNVRRDERINWMAWGISQRVDPNTNIKTSIAVGQKRYWNDLGSGEYFRGRTLKQCLDVLHEDITLVWNFYDPKKLVSNDRFKALMARSISDLTDERANTAPLTGAHTLQVTVAAEPTIVAASYPKWVYYGYGQNPVTLRCLMAYIVDLTIIAWKLFPKFDAIRCEVPLYQELVQEAFDQFSRSKLKILVHAKIRAFVDNQDSFNLRKGDIFDKIVQLITQITLQRKEVLRIVVGRGGPGIWGVK